MNSIEEIKANPELVVRYMASKRFINFARYVKPNLDITNFHKVYYTVLDKFSKGEIRRLIISVPPQSGKSEGASRLLPAFLLGLNPDLKITIGSYNADQAKSFNYDVQKIINSEAYKAVFPDSYLNTSRVRMDNVYKCNSEVSEMVGHNGSLRAVGRSGSLTGKSVDVSILDDVYKDYNEAVSPLIREQAWKWYTTVVRTRLHNDSQELIVFTRWHEDDLIGRLEKSGEKIVLAKKWSDLEVNKNVWVHLNFPALKVSSPTELDPREKGEALWPSRHSKEKLLEAKALDPVQFECLYQGNPGNEESLLYSSFKTYVDKNDYGTFVRRCCCVDVADKGNDYLCSIVYEVYKSPNSVYNEKTKKFEPLMFCLVTDVLFTQEGTEVTSVSLPMQINFNGVYRVFIESNNGGQGFANIITKKVKAQVISKFTKGNKEARILSNASEVVRALVFPLGWTERWPRFAEALTSFRRDFNANSHDDAPDCCTMIIENELLSPRPYRRRGVRRGN